MPKLHIKDIIIEFDGDDLTKYGPVLVRGSRIEKLQRFCQRGR